MPRASAWLISSRSVMPSMMSFAGRHARSGWPATVQAERTLARRSPTALARRRTYLASRGLRRVGRISRVDSAFLPGTMLAGRYYLEVVRPLLDGHAPGLEHSAALIGWGSDVLGFDSPRSTDHNWGPRCLIFLGPGDADRATALTAMLD